MPATALLEPRTARSGRATATAPEPVTEADLCGRASAGRAATDALVAKYTPMVHKIVNDLVLPPTVERDDLVQAGLMAVVRATEKWRPGGSTFFTYAYTCASNAVRREAGAEARKTASLHDRPLEEGGCELLDLLPARPPAATAEDVRERVAKLPPLYRLVVGLHFGLEGEPLGAGEIARAAGLTVPQVKRAVEIGLAQLKAMG